MAKDFRSRLIPIETEEPKFKSRLIPIKESSDESLARSIAQPALGYAEMTGPGIAGELSRLAGTGESLQEYEDLKAKIPELKRLFPNAPWENFNEEEFFNPERFGEALETAQEYDPFTVSGLGNILEDITGIPLRPQTRVQKTLRFGGQASKLGRGNLSQKIKFGAKATAAKEALQESGVPEPIAEIAGIVAGDIKFPKLAKGEVKKLPSGLTQPKAVEAKHPKLGTLSKERQTAVIDKLDKEATDLIKTSVEKHQPKTKQIQEGFDFEGQFQKQFSEVEKLASKANPEIDVTPVSNLMSETGKKYRGIPQLHPEAKKIKAEVKAFGNRPPTSLRNLLKTYRSNNQKIRNIYETSRLTGKQREYVDFLTNYNKAIADSFRETLPKDSAWLKMFEGANRDFKNFKDAEKTLNQLREVFGENPTLQKVERLADDIRKQKQLSLSMGEQGSREIVQIAKDLKKVKEAIKTIPSSEITKFDAAFPLYYLIPFLGKAIGVGVSAAKAIKFGRYGYGWMLSTPARRKAYGDILKALKNQDLESYKKAALILIKESNSS